MRAAIIGVAVSLAIAAAPARAEQLPPGSLGVLVGAVSGTGADAATLGFGYETGVEAAWQPMATERRFGWALKWTCLCISSARYNTSARIDDKLLTLQMDFLVGIRIRPGVSPRRYLTVRGGGALFRVDQAIGPKMQRAFAGAVASIGLDQYAFGALLFNVDVRYSLIGTGPTEIALLFGASFTGP